MTTGAQRLPRATAEQLGVDPGGIAALVGALAHETPELHSFMLVRHGHVVAEAWVPPFSSDRPHLLYSLSKTFTAAAVGFARDEGLLDLDDLLVDLLGRLTPEHVSDEALGALPADARARLGRLRVHDLLTMTTGHDDDPSGRAFEQDDWLAGFLAEPLAHEPGTHFVYNTVATYVLGELVQRAAGQRLVDYLEPRLLAPLGIAGVTWDRSPSGYDAGGFGMSATTEDLAVLGALFLRDGTWDGRQVLPDGWAELASARQVPNGTGAPGDAENDWAQGYGFQMWRCRHGAYRGDGAFGQYCIVLPEQDAVVAITSSVPDMGAQLALVWKHLLPALHPQPLGADLPGRLALGEVVAGLRLDPPPGAATSAGGEALHGRLVELEENPVAVSSFVLEVGAEADVLRVVVGGDEVRLVAGHAAPVVQTVPPLRPGGPASHTAAVSGVWAEPDEYVLTVRFLDMPHTATLRARVDGDRVTVRGGFDLWMGDGTLPELVGSVAAAARAAR